MKRKILIVRPRCRGTADQRLLTSAAITLAQRTSNKIRPIMYGDTKMIRHPLGERIVRVVNSMDSTVVTLRNSCVVCGRPLPGLIRSSPSGMSFITERGPRFGNPSNRDVRRDPNSTKDLREASTNVALNVAERNGSKTTSLLLADIAS